MQRKRIIGIVVLFVITTSILAMVTACNKHTHTFSNEWTYDANYHWQACTGCDEVRYKSEHDWDEGAIILAPTATTEGKREYTCETCGKTRSEVFTIKHEHVFNYKRVEEKFLKSPVDCVNKAVYYYSCECGEKGVDTFEYGEPLGHSFTDYKYNNDATCTEDGTKTAKCDRCDVTDTITVAGTATGHTFSTEWSRDDDYHWHAANCEHTSLIADKNEHNWQDTGKVIVQPTEEAEGEKEQECSVCKTTRIVNIPNLTHEHTYSAWTEDEKDDTLHKKVCDGCGDVAKEEHDYDSSNKCNSCGVVRKFLVVFEDGFGNVIEAQKVKYEESAIVPQDPSDINDYYFVGWKGNFSLVESDITIIAQWKKYCILTFVDYNGIECGRLQIMENNNVKEEDLEKIIPDNPEGYTFDGWNIDIEAKITEDAEITAKYEIIKFSVKFKMPNGEVLDEQSVAYGLSAIAPEFPEYFYNVEKNRAFAFKKLETYFTDENGKEVIEESGYKNVKKDLIVKSIYDKEVDRPIITLIRTKSATNSNQTNVDIKVTLPSGKKLYAIDIKLHWTGADAGISEDVSINDTSSPIRVISHGDNKTCSMETSEINDNIKHDNMKKIFYLSWVCVNGHEIGSNSLVTLLFEGIEEDNLFSLMENSTFMIGEKFDSTEDVERVTPILLIV